MMDNQKYEKIQ
jgi:hypothetical protein